MPIIKSAKKRVRVAEKATIRNVKTKRSIRAAIKALQAAISSGDNKNTTTALSKAQSELDKAAKKGLLHKNTVARRKSKLAAKAKAAGTKPEAKKAVKPAAAKKTTAKKPAAKKPAAKKTTTKKTTEK